jgi:FKBP-type peptidyl-prolyl cis-trans isomerase (trigger factor)
MATVTRENIGVLNDKITVKVNKEDYLSSFEKTLKTYSKSANIPGFRKGMVPPGIIKKMHGQAVFTDEVLRTVEKELTKYMTDEKLDIFAQPLPLAENDARSLDVNNPTEYSFGFEVGLKPEFQVPDLSQEKVKYYKINVTDQMVNEHIERLQKGYGKKKDPDAGNEEENIEKAEINEDLFKAAYPGKEIKNEEEFRAEIKRDIEAYWESESKKQFQHEIYHRLLNHSDITFPENFLKRWLETGTEKQKSPEEVEKEYPGFVNQLKWTLINDRIGADQKLEITADDIKAFAKKQLFGYMGMQMMDEEQPWVEEYVNKMMQDRKFLDDSYFRLRTDKLFEWAENQVLREEVEINAEEFEKMVHDHSHEHAHEHEHEHEHDHE